MEIEGLQNLLMRTTLNVSFEEFLTRLKATYSKIGNIEKFEPIFEGYEDANIKLFTTQGIYVVKVFFKKRSLQNILNYVRVLEESQALHIPVIKLIQGKKGYLNYIEEGNIKTPYFVTEFFQGDNFRDRTPTLNDMQRTAHYLATLNTLNFPIDGTYDSWGNRNLFAEYQQNKTKLTPEVNTIVEPIANELKDIYFAQFPTKGVIHGDMQRKHVLKNKEGEYCILDFGCMGNAPIVIDISVFLAWFCLGEDTWAQREKIMEIVLTEYKKLHTTLSQEEINALPLLVKAAYAAYYMTTSILIQNVDKTIETRRWHADAKVMLELTKDWIF